MKDVGACSSIRNATDTVGGNMAIPMYDMAITALLVIDPYNDFISEGGKLWDHLKGVAEANKCVPICCKF